MPGCGNTPNPSRNATDPDIALAISEDYETQKLYSSDTGLLIAQAFASRPYTENELYRALLLDKLSVNEGMVAENAVAQALRTNGVELFFYSRPDKGDGEGRMEIDFLVPAGGFREASGLIIRNHVDRERKEK